MMGTLNRIAKNVEAKLQEFAGAGWIVSVEFEAVDKPTPGSVRTASVMKVRHWKDNEKKEPTYGKMQGFTTAETETILAAGELPKHSFNRLLRGMIGAELKEEEREAITTPTVVESSP